MFLVGIIFSASVLSTQHRSVWMATVAGFILMLSFTIQRKFLLTSLAIIALAVIVLTFIGLSINNILDQSILQSAANN